MRDLKETISGIEFKLRQLIRKYNDLKIASETLVEQKSELESKVNQQEAVINQLKLQIQTQEIANSLKENKGSEKVHSRIDELVREIDRCVQLLNN
ncbi:MAG: hypothetical protein JEZ03_09840 [Bacteroidales bacterium]|nr:hypothetical protein [Bacteroidales bacterium]